jgi:molybdopterin-guanine dinucleotide biosynthesis protein A
VIKPADITGLILAGGRGSRMGGVDKGLQPFNGIALALHTLKRLYTGGGVGQVVINANRNLALYESFGTSVWPDEITNYAGPLAGFQTGLVRCTTPFLVTVPCDTPLLPLDLVPRLTEALDHQNAEIAMVSSPEVDKDGLIRMRAQPVFCLIRVGLLESLSRFTQDGGRKIVDWTDQHKTVIVPFDLPGDDPLAFCNANSLAELHQLENTRA